MQFNSAMVKGSWGGLGDQDWEAGGGSTGIFPVWTDTPNNRTHSELYPRERKPCMLTHNFPESKILSVVGTKQASWPPDAQKAAASSSDFSFFTRASESKAKLPCRQHKPVQGSCAVSSLCGKQRRGREETVPKVAAFWVSVFQL